MEQSVSNYTEISNPLHLDRTATNSYKSIEEETKKQEKEEQSPTKKARNENDCQVPHEHKDTAGTQIQIKGCEPTNNVQQ